MLGFEEWVAATPRLRSSRKNRELASLGIVTDLPQQVQQLYTEQRITRASARKAVKQSEHTQEIQLPTNYQQTLANTVPATPSQSRTTRASTKVNKA